MTAMKHPACRHRASNEPAAAMRMGYDLDYDRLFAPPSKHRPPSKSTAPLHLDLDGALTSRHGRRAQIVIGSDCHRAEALRASMRLSIPRPAAAGLNAARAGPTLPIGEIRARIAAKRAGWRSNRLAFMLARIDLSRHSRQRLRVAALSRDDAAEAGSRRQRVISDDGRASIITP